jgi:hypothetical protein
MERSKEAARSPRLGQAVEMVRLQLSCTLEDAFALLDERAKMLGQNQSSVAEALVNRRIQFRPYA